METYEIEICGDCLIWHANADSTGIADPERERVVREAPEVPDGYHVLLGGDDLGFRWHSPCGTCGDRLGGDRFSAVLAPFGQ